MLSMLSISLIRTYRTVFRTCYNGQDNGSILSEVSAPSPFLLSLPAMLLAMLTAESPFFPPLLNSHPRFYHMPEQK